MDRSPWGEDAEACVGTKLDALLQLSETGCELHLIRLLRLFGEASSACGNYDDCLTRPEEWDAEKGRPQAHVMHLPL